MNVALLRMSFDLLKPQAQTLVDRFYAILFDRHPRLKPLFAHTSMPEQKGKLIQALAFVVANLERPETLRATLGAMGERHRGYGVTDEMYEAVGDALLAAMADVAGPSWSPTLRDAWAMAYGAVAHLMRSTPAAAKA
ncbi:MAG TPA: globin domain-containing protein [Planctomycetota bacterium]